MPVESSISDHSWSNRDDFSSLPPSGSSSSFAKRWARPQDTAGIPGTKWFCNFFPPFFCGFLSYIVCNLNFSKNPFIDQPCVLRKAHTPRGVQVRRPPRSPALSHWVRDTSGMNLNGLVGNSGKMSHFVYAFLIGIWKIFQGQLISIALMCVYSYHFLHLRKNSPWLPLWKLPELTPIAKDWAWKPRFGG